jgi:hypothetical protein
MIVFTHTECPRSLSSFEAFDAASRGPGGALLLLGTAQIKSVSIPNSSEMKSLMSFSHLASLGATLSVLSLAFQPFVQQAISFRQRTSPHGNGTILYRRNLTIRDGPGSQVPTYQSFYYTDAGTFRNRSYYGESRACKLFVKYVSAVTYRES